LEDLLDESQRHLDESKAYINQLRQQQREEKKERAMYVFCLPTVARRSSNQSVENSQV
jgi:hypothetical protein